MPEPRSALVWVQHLLGVGHAMRAVALARALAASGWRVAVASGGPAPAGLNPGGAALHPLPSLRASDAEFSGLLTDTGLAPDEAYWRRREDALTTLVDQIVPDVILVEHFPFGRRAFRREISHLLSERRGKTGPFRAVCSVRDILVNRKPERVTETVAAVNHDFDLVLVHGDPALVPLEASFPRAGEIADRLRYTGYIGGDTTGAPEGAPEPDAEILVSAGGGAVGDALIEAAIAAARARGPVPGWRILVGRSSVRTAEQWAEQAPAWVTAEAARPDFRRLLSRAAASVSQAGYNTVVDILQARARAILVPFARARETEQTLRAERLAALGLARHLPEAGLTPEALNIALDAALAEARPAPAINLDGAGNSVRILEEAIGR